MHEYLLPLSSEVVVLNEELLAKQVWEIVRNDGTPDDMKCLRKIPIREYWGFGSNDFELISQRGVQWVNGYSADNVANYSRGSGRVYDCADCSSFISSTRRFNRNAADAANTAATIRVAFIPTHDLVDGDKAWEQADEKKCIHFNSFYQENKPVDVFYRTVKRAGKLLNLTDNLIIDQFFRDLSANNIFEAERF
ncbi:22758_t:CDS:2 [Rhizophagus irregularis]|nr:22758_t:CDS:2 [Rhizophagus irregularis]